MRNLKKILALVLALVMSFSLMATANAFKDDEQISGDYAEAVEVLNGLGVFQGYEDGSFKPQGAITRAEVAAIIYRIVTGDVADNQVAIYSDYNKFTDTNEAKWAAGYIGFCANAEYIKGYGDGKFGPNDKVTGYQALAMILRAVGYDKNGEFTGAGWQVQVASTAKKLGILENIVEGTLGTPATREVVAEILFQTIANVPQVEYTLAFGYQPISIAGAPGQTNATLGYQTFKLVPGTRTELDAWGRPGYYWYSNGVVIATIEEPYYAQYTTAVTECQVAQDRGFSASKTFATYTNGFINAGVDTLSATETVATIGAQGRLTEVYSDRIVYIDTLLAQVVSVRNAAFDSANHLISPATIVLNVFDTNTTTTTDDTHSPVINANTYTQVTLTNGSTNYTYATGDMVLVNAVQYNTGRVRVNADQYVVILNAAPSLVGAQTVIWYNAAQHTVNGTVYSDNNRFHLDQAGFETTNHTWYFDNNNNLIGATDIASVYTYGVVSNIYWVNTDGVGAAYATITYMDGTTDTAKIASIDRWVATGERSATAAGAYAEDCKPVYALSGTALAVIPGTPNTVGISTWAADNAALFGDDLYRISTLSDGSLKLDAVDEMASATIRTGVSLIQGSASKTSTAKKIYTNSNTQYLVKDYYSNTYTPITGFNNIYSYTQYAYTTIVDYVDVNGDGYMDYVYVQGCPDYTYADKLVYVTNSSYQTFFYEGDPTPYYCVSGVNIDGSAAEVYTDDFANVVLPMISNVGKLFFVSYVEDWAYQADEVTAWAYQYQTAAATDVSSIYGADMVAVRMDGATLNGDVLATVNGNTRFNVTNSTTYAGDLANIGTHIVYVLVNKATTEVQGVYVSTLPAHIATAAAVTLTETVSNVSIISNTELAVSGGQTITNVALEKTSDWNVQGDDSYTVTGTDSEGNTWFGQNVRTVGAYMTFDLVAPDTVIDGTTVTLSWS